MPVIWEEEGACGAEAVETRGSGCPAVNGREEEGEPPRARPVGLPEGERSRGSDGGADFQGDTRDKGKRREQGRGNKGGRGRRLSRVKEKYDGAFLFWSLQQEFFLSVIASAMFCSWIERDR